MQLVAVDIGGTHARFALAEVEQGRVVSLGEAVTLKTAEHGSFQLAWEEFGRTLGTPLPKAAAIAVAGPVGGEIIRFTNNPWIIRPALIPEKLGADDYVVVNDFAAVAHAVAQAAHGSAPDIANQNKANPTALVISAQMLLKWHASRSGNNQLASAAAHLETALDDVLADPANHTVDIGGNAGTDEFGEALARAVDQ